MTQLFRFLLIFLEIYSNYAEFTSTESPFNNSEHLIEANSYVFALDTLRHKKSVSTVCIKIKINKDGEEPYYMCKGKSLKQAVEHPLNGFKIDERKKKEKIQVVRSEPENLVIELDNENQLVDVQSTNDVTQIFGKPELEEVTFDNSEKTEQTVGSDEDTSDTSEEEVSTRQPDQTRNSLDFSKTSMDNLLENDNSLAEDSDSLEMELDVRMSYNDNYSCKRQPSACCVRYRPPPCPGSYSYGKFTSASDAAYQSNFGSPDYTNQPERFSLSKPSNSEITFEITHHFTPDQTPRPQAPLNFYEAAPQEHMTLYHGILRKPLETNSNKWPIDKINDSQIATLSHIQHLIDGKDVRTRRTKQKPFSVEHGSNKNTEIVRKFFPSVLTPVLEAKQRFVWY